MIRIFILLASVICVTACSTPVSRPTLRDVDQTQVLQSQDSAFIAPRSAEEIKRAYAEYLKFASKSDLSRQDALLRIAQMEFNLSEKMAKEIDQRLADEAEDSFLAASLNHTIELLLTSLRDYPDSKDNDKAYYQLAKAYDQRGEYEKSLEALQRLTTKHKTSPFYLEAQFRIAEDNFSRKHYSKAEDIYTEIIVARKNNPFYEKALYKRGWSRFKLEYYSDAADDFAKTIGLNPFDDYHTLPATQKEQMDEYFRAIALSFIYQGGAAPLAAFLKANPDYKHVYLTCASVSDAYLKQEQYSDAAEILEQFIKRAPKSLHASEAQLKVISIWKNAGFTQRAVNSIESAYNAYHPKSAYWSDKGSDSDSYRQIRLALKEHIITAAAQSHHDYNRTGKNQSFDQAKTWYERYLEHYESEARKDNVHFLYADLLNRHKQLPQALQHYEQAAYDSDIILNKDAAYESIIVSAQIYKAAHTSDAVETYLAKLIKYSQLYAQLYPNDSRSLNILTYAAETAFEKEKYSEAIKIASMAPANGVDAHDLNLIKANSYYKLQEYKAAEESYLSIPGKSSGYRNMLRIKENLALSIYKQAEAAAANNDIDQALKDYARIADTVADSTIAATGLLDAITLAINNAIWQSAVVNSRRFQSLYPNHPQSHDVTKQLSVALLESKQYTDAASVLDTLSKSDSDREYQMAALWKAAELYESDKNYASAIAKYEEYADRFKSPYPQYLEAMHKLAQIHGQQGSTHKALNWRRRIMDDDTRASNTSKNDRTKYIASLAAISLAKQEHTSFQSIRLTLPLEQTLKQKKQIMQAAITLYSKVSSYGIAATATEATYAIGEIYREFSKSLLESERPGDLSDTESEQYRILLEDQAFPFEEKAIEFYEANLGHIKNGHQDEWVEKSYAQLKVLFPTRYNREALLDEYVDVLH